jgi:DNA processing protein
MNLDQLKFGIGITLINGIGNNLAKNLIAFLGNEEAVFKEKKSNLSKIPGIGEKLAAEISGQHNVLKRAEAEIEFMLKNNIQHYYFAENNYPFRLKECPDAPLILFSKGNYNINASRIVGIVGTRNATDYGKTVCENFIRELASVPGLLIVSGLAFGIDICAHKYSLENNIPTIGVIAHGLDRIYPQSHRPTAVKMLSNGGIVTEYISGTNPDRQNFVQRNRIIAGLSDVIVVIESAEKGGALITADFANDYNRDVFAFPGRIADVSSRGCNMLIKQNRASLIDDTGDFVRLMGWEDNITRKSENQMILFQDLSDDEQRIYSSLKSNSEGIHVNLLSVELSFPYSKLTSILLEMEFKLLVKCLPGGIYKAL